ncbi:MAG: DUF4249 domain-containing protein [Flavobacteriaceae bacterium]|nr:MAG: DUF4249 domain-containing protein [Flavobacteriaceae bacterium]
MRRFKTYGFILILMALYGCVEEIDLRTEIQEEYESALVIEATLTNEMKNQVILLSRVYLLEEEGPSPEFNAQVRVLDGNGNSYQFQQVFPGRYESESIFAAQPNTVYELEINTSDGGSYGSSMEELTNETQINDLYVERDFNENNEEGVSIYVDSFDPTGNSLFYRYTYEETFKIIAPDYSPEDMEYEYIYGNPDNPTEITGVLYFLVQKEEQQQICFATVASEDIIISSTNDLNEDSINRFRVRFLGRDNPIISHRYSILVRQYVQSPEAFEYYKTLKEFSDSDNLLSQSQPGFLNGNVFSETDQEEKVIGFFQVSSVDEKRVYFNYADLFPGDVLPPYFQSCVPFAPLESRPGPTFPLANALDLGNKYLEPNEDPLPDEGSYYLVAPACGNCTVIGNNFPPDFWEE